MPDISAGVDLVRRAFDAARASGKKEDWQRMTIPVLKNRMLLLTGGQFREADYGASSFRDFLNRLPAGSVTVDDSHAPGFAVLVTEGAVSGKGHTAPSYPRIRRDLWRAALDFSSGRRYVWDSSIGEARPATPKDEGPFLPTVSPEGFREWRTQFATGHGAHAPTEVAERLEQWSSQNLPTTFLPARIRPLWNIDLKRRVQERLTEWFEERRIDIPGDLVSVQQLVDSAPRPAEDLRQFVIDCIRVMSERELEELPIPARVAMRVRSSDTA
jgi:hypothetical protein